RPFTRPCRVTIIMEEEDEARQQADELPLELFIGLLPNGSDHAHAHVRIVRSMLEVEGEIARADVNLPSGHKDRFNPDAIVSDIAFGRYLRALIYGADCVEVFLREAILIALYDDTVAVKTETDPRLLSGRSCLRVLVVIGVLQEFKDEPRVALV